MKSSPCARSLRGLLASLIFLLPGLAVAQIVPYTAKGFVSVTSIPPVYNGQYVLQATDYGFFWLDTVALKAGLVQVAAKCDLGLPTPVTNIYIVGDCNGTGNVISSGNQALVRLTNSQCGTTKGCNGPPILVLRFSFELGTWKYLGDAGTIPNSTQTTDPQGRTWTVGATDFSGTNFAWTASGPPNSPPIASAFASNLSAATRGDQANYYGDKWQLRDTSTSGPAAVTWDFNYKGSFAADESGSEAPEGVISGYFPCDPAGITSGDIRSGANCRQSLGLGNPPAAGNYAFAMRSANQFGSSANTFVSSPFSVACPEAVIAAYSGFSGTCSKTGAPWSCRREAWRTRAPRRGTPARPQPPGLSRFPSGPPTGLQGNVVAVPGGANGFALTMTFPGGYQAIASGLVVQTAALVAAFSAPVSVARGTSLSITNQMQKPPTTTLDSVDWLIASGACGVPPPIPANPLPPSFLADSGSAQISAPNATGAFCIYLKYNYTTPVTAQTSQIVSRSLTVTDWIPAPAIGIYLDAARTQLAPFGNSTFFLNAGTDYFLFDEEAPPPAGVIYPGAQWILNSPSGSKVLGSTAVQASLKTPFLKSCASGCSIRPRGRSRGTTGAGEYLRPAAQTPRRCAPTAAASASRSRGPPPTTAPVRDRPFP